ncbi:MAG: energy transducer TonB [Robiginitomaculum sp.]|nr:energy transducer TonB [Robiginitomaculum sp.]
MARTFLISVLIFVFSAAGGLAASPMVEAFKEYQAALGVGDIRKADEAGERAWKLATQAGKSKTEAVLAYNLAELRLRYLPDADALTPARRVAEIKTSGVAVSISQEDVDIVYAVSLYRDNASRINLQKLVKVAQRYKKLKNPASYPMYLANLDLLADAVSKKNWKLVHSLSIDTQKSFQDNQITNDGLLIDLKLMQIGAFVAYNRRHNIKDYQPIFQDIHKILHKYPQDVYEVRRLKHGAWFSAINGIFRSKISTQRNLMELAHDEHMEHEQEPEICPEFNWEQRNKPKYPRKLLEKGHIGSAVINYSLTSEGTTYDVSVAIEVPSNVFGEYAVEAIKEWRVKYDSKPSAACLAIPKRTTVTYAISPMY